MKTSDEKIEICKACEHYVAVIMLDACDITKYPVVLMSQNEEADCPLGKWNGP